MAILFATLPSVPALVTTSCEGHECDATSYEYGCASSEDAACCAGCMIDENTWATTPEDANWLNFPASGTIRLPLNGWIGNRVLDPSQVEIMIAPAPPQGPTDPLPADASPDAPASIEAVATGDLGEYSFVGQDEVDVMNGTCSAAVARITVGFISQADGGVVELGPCWKQHPVFCK
jgi:hypothetical protein